MGISPPIKPDPRLAWDITRKRLQGPLTLPPETPAEGIIDIAIRLLGEIGISDMAKAHAAADAILCALLNDLGYGKVVKAWEAISYER